MRITLLNSAPSTLLALLLIACSGTSEDRPGAGPGDAGDGGNEGGDTDPGDTDEGGDGYDTGPIEQVPGGDGEVIFEPDGGGFLYEVDVSLRSSTGTGELWYCLAPPTEDDCSFREYDEPFELDESMVVHAQLRIGGAADETVARAFFEVDDELADWDTNVPLMVLWSDDDKPSSTSDRVPFAVTVIDADGGRIGLTDEPESSGRGRIRLRGSSSSSFSKPSYDLELWAADSDDDRPEEMLGMPKDGDWVLYGPYYYDDGLIRNALAYQLSNDVGRYASRTRFVEVFLAEDGRSVRERNYMGVYTLVEEIERGADRVDVTELTPDDVDQPELTGGYVFKRDRPDDDDSSLSCGSAGGAIYFEYGLQAVDPEEHELVDVQLSYVDGLCDALGYATVSDDFTDPASGLHYTDIIDVDSFIDHHIINVIMKNPDSFRLSGYLHKDRDGLIQAGPVWDFDRASASADYRSSYPTWWDAWNQTSDCTPVFEYGWYEGLFNDPEFSDAYWTRFEELLDGPLSAEAIDAHIVDMADQLDEAADRNADTWSSRNFDDETALIRDWMQTRVAWIGDCIATYENPQSCPG